MHTGIPYDTDVHCPLTKTSVEPIAINYRKRANSTQPYPEDHERACPDSDSDFHGASRIDSVHCHTSYPMPPSFFDNAMSRIDNGNHDFPGDIAHGNILFGSQVAHKSHDFRRPRESDNVSALSCAGGEEVLGAETLMDLARPSTVKDLTCHFCLDEFSKKSALKRHMETVHNLSNVIPYE